MVNKWIQFTVAPENCADFHSALKILEKESKAEEGCVYYAVFKVDDTEGRYTVLESWASKDAFEAHRVAPHIAAFKNNCGGIILEKSALSLTPIAQETKQ